MFKIKSAKQISEDNYEITCNADGVLKEITPDLLRQIMYEIARNIGHQYVKENYINIAKTIDIDALKNLIIIQAAQAFREK